MKSTIEKEFNLGINEVKKNRKINKFKNKQAKFDFCMQSIMKNVSLLMVFFIIGNIYFL